MKKPVLIGIVVSFLSVNLFSQNTFNYSIELQTVNISELPGLHSYAFGQHDGKWLIIGGRKDGLHARQPFLSFPNEYNNTDIYVIDVNSRQFWSASLNVLPLGIREQLQSTNMNFYQDNDTLYIIGGYAYSESTGNHITFPYLTSVQVSSLVDAVISGNNITPFFKQITGDIFTITGGQLGKIDDTFFLVGGHRFDGRYNPMNGPSFTQTYSNQIRKFTINNSGTQLSFLNYSTITDPIHLRRRDYNLLPQIFPNGTEGYTISSGVFQADADLPFLYPVDITASGYNPLTEFNQYLNHYHSAKAALYDSVRNEMHSLFFGGMSQYYYKDGALIKDDLVPFVKTISLLTRYHDGTLEEFQLPFEMPGLKGASAEFIPNQLLPHYTSEIIKLSKIPQDEFIIGHIYGGILSPSLNPFANNQTNTTSADPSIYAVKLIRNKPSTAYKIDGKNPYHIHVYPNPASKAFTIEYNCDKIVKCHYYLTNSAGQIISEGNFKPLQAANNKETIRLEGNIPPQTLYLTV
ncbi:MAG: hypothetical protein ABR597_12930, partial [Bacteroidales bacterium]